MEVKAYKPENVVQRVFLTCILYPLNVAYVSLVTQRAWLICYDVLIHTFMMLFSGKAVG